jgi:hypothetical protein
MIRYLLLLSVFALSLSSCSDDSNDDFGPQVSMSLSVTQAMPLQVVTATVEGFEVGPAEYSGQVGGMATVFIRSSELSVRSLSFVVPADLAPGQHVVEVEVEGYRLTTALQVVAGVSVADPDAVFDAFYADYTTPAYAGLLSGQEFLNAINDLKALPESDKLLAARMLANNRAAIDQLAVALTNAEELTGESFGKTEDCDAICKLGVIATAAGAFLSAPAIAAVGAGIFVGMVIRAFKPVVSALFAKLREAFSFGLQLGYDRMAYTYDLLFDPNDFTISNKVTALPDTLFIEGGQVLQLAIRTVREPLVNENNRTVYPVVGTLLDLYYRIQDAIAGSEFSLPGLMTGEVVAFPSGLEGFSIAVDNPLVIPSAITGTADLARVSFSTTQDGAHPFTFTYSYANELGEVTSFSQACRIFDISEYALWSGPGVNFFSTNPDYIIGQTTSGNPYGLPREWFTVEVSSYGQINEPGAGIVTYDAVWLRMENFNGIGTYTSAAGNAFIQDVRVSLQVDASGQQDFCDAPNYCFYVGDIEGNHELTVNITEYAVLGQYIVVAGDFSVTMLNQGSTFCFGSACALPATFSGTFRTAASTL